MNVTTGIRKFPLRQYARDPVALTALWYLKEALLEEKYEKCAEFIAVAKEFGAKKTDIQALLEDPRRRP